MKFTETAEPESFHPDKANRSLWAHLPDAYTRIWNGLRGGLIVPAADMEFSGLSFEAFISQMKNNSPVFSIQPLFVSQEREAITYLSKEKERTP